MPIIELTDVTRRYPMGDVHDIAEYASRVVVVKDGRVQSDQRRIPVPAVVPPLEESA